MSKKYTAFISDIHLDPEAEHTTALFDLFLQQMQHKLTRLFILGDLFEYWIGDDDLNSFNRSIIIKLKQLSEQGIELYFLPGNRDFLIGRKFLTAIGAKRLPDPCPINLYGRSMVLMHGDLLCTDDTKYLAFRKWAHKRWLQKLFLCFPLFLRRRIAAKLRKKSRMHMRHVTSSQLDVTQIGVEQIAFRVFTREFLIHGHTHKPGEHQVALRKKRLVLGAWHHEGSMIICNEQLPPKLVRFNSAKPFSQY